VREDCFRGPGPRADTRRPHGPGRLDKLKPKGHYKAEHFRALTVTIRPLGLCGRGMFVVPGKTGADRRRGRCGCRTNVAKLTGR